MPVERIASFLSESVSAAMPWDRVRLLGGEPTLHPDFRTIVEMLLAYTAKFRPGLRIVVCTNGSGRHVQETRDRLPGQVVAKSTDKGTSAAPVPAVQHGSGGQPPVPDFGLQRRVPDHRGLRLGLTPAG